MTSLFLRGDRWSLQTVFKVSLCVVLLLTLSSRADNPTPFFGNLPGPHPDPELSLKSATHDWYKDAVVYHLWVSAFHDSDNNGMGDLRGITQRLDVLQDLGITAIWLSPFFTSASTPRNLHGYDVIDHYTVDPRLGTNEDARELIRQSHARGIRLILDFVPNHLSSRHPWFIESRNRNSPRRNWFVWRDDRPEKGWTGFDNRSDWHPLDNAYYYGIFWGGMPDVNHRNPQVRHELAKAARFWLDLGFDGLRIDAVKYMYENLEGAGVKSDWEDRPESFAWFEQFRSEVLEPYTKAGFPKFMVAENWTSDRGSLLSYMSRDGRSAFHMTLNFGMLPAFTRLDLAHARNWWEWDAQLPTGAWLSTFNSNHDLAADRPGTLFAKDQEKLRAQAAWLLLGPGTPFLYYGNEIAQPQGPERGDTKHRKPLNWDDVLKQREAPDSVWRWHQRLIEIRRSYPSLRRGKATFLQTSAGDKVLALWRTEGKETTLTIFNADASIDNLTVQLPKGVSQSGRSLIHPNAKFSLRDGTLQVGPLDPYQVEVVHWLGDTK